ncbi:DUF4279 domain-containing protein [Nocardioides sp. CPCC 206347]|uniref:DUF4279 domain-containing protein n=1 Tax=unclassified Nocardioides TaxID=2615069 RepID=UPI003613FA1F
MNQYAYFQLGSTTRSAAELSTEIGMEPDEVRVRGSKRAEPPIPARHSWEIVNRAPNMDVEDLVAPLLDRISPVASRIRDLTDSEEVHATLVVVRYFNDRNGVAEEQVETEQDGHQLVKMPGQHQMLGWALEPEALGLLASMNATIWFDEYSWPQTMG